jgi:hypothetical protein
MVERVERRKLREVRTQCSNPPPAPTRPARGPVDVRPLSDYPKTGGWAFSFQTRLARARWNDSVVDIIALGQRVAYAWTLTGDVFRSPEGWSTKSRISGVTAIQWQLRTPGQADVGRAYDTN